MSDQKNTASMRTIVLFLILVPVIIYLLNFAYKKNKESAQRAQQCQVQCTDQGYLGYEFKWDILSGPQCQCLEINQ